jgi:CheY-like chemotaxis protein
MRSPIGNVLVVDDDRAMCDMIATVLSPEGYNVVPAEDGLEALHLLRTVRRSTGAPCLVLLDLQMPRLSGSEFRRAQLRDPTVSNVPVAIMSGAPDADAHARALGAMASVPKPIDFEALLTIVRRYCS